MKKGIKRSLTNDDDDEYRPVNRCGASIGYRKYVKVRRNPIRQCRQSLVVNSFGGGGRGGGRGGGGGGSGSGGGGSGSGEYRSVKLYTAYLGYVDTQVFDFGNGNVAMQAQITGLDGKPIYVKCVDSVANRITMDRQYDIRQLAQLPPTIINIAENKRVWDQLQSIGVNDTERKHFMLSKLNVVDIQFQTCEFLGFMHDKLKINSMNDDGVLVSVHNFQKLDNAFNTGSYMIYGNGDKMFYPLGCIDVTGHELIHGLTQTLAGLKYEGESGAMNEGFSDIVGCMFEYWMYQKYNDDADKTNDINGCFDWFVGEDIGKSVRYLRNIADPTKSSQPQPKKYKGQHWANSSGVPSEENDQNGVHTNSGVLNYCFYLYAQRIGLYESLTVFINVLKSLKPTSQYSDFATELKKQTLSAYAGAVTQVLREVGLM